MLMLLLLYLIIMQCDYQSLLTLYKNMVYIPGYNINFNTSNLGASDLLFL